MRRSVCAHDCPDACSIEVTVEGGRVVQFRGDHGHPVTRGFLCGKVNSYEDVVYSTERVLRPLRRRGPKGAGDFEEISWDDAIALAAEMLRVTADRFGGESLLQYYYAGTMGIVNRFSGEAFFNRLGATALRQNICYYGADAGYAAAVGGGYGLDPEDIVHSDLILAWGANVVSTQVHLVPFIDEARKRGAPLWTIDPYRNRTAARSDRWLAVKPGTDVALALGLLHVLERDGAVDRDFIARRTEGYELLSAEVLPRFAPHDSARITGVPAETILELAELLAAARAPAFKVGIGLGRSSHGAAAVWAICCLAGALGAYESRGAGVQYDTGCEFRFCLDPITRPDWRDGPARELNMTALGEALCEWDAPPVKLLYVHGTNPAATAPEQARVIEGLSRDDLFTVVHERFLTDTARYADLVLPACTFVESSDLFKSYGHLYLQYAARVIEPLGESRPNLAVFQALGKALGWDDPWFDHDVEHFVREVLAATTHGNFAGIEAERVLSGETIRLRLPRGQGGFAARFNTPSGRLRFYSREHAEAGLPAMPDYRGDPFNERPDEFPLRLITPPAHAFLSTSFGQQEKARRREGGEPRVLVHPADAGAADIADGDVVELSNELGRLEIVARVTEDTRPGVLVAEGIWWPGHGRGAHGINVLASARLTDLGGGSTFHDNRVALRRLEANRAPAPATAAARSHAR